MGQDIKCVRCKGRGEVVERHFNYGNAASWVIYIFLFPLGMIPFCFFSFLILLRIHIFDFLFFFLGGMTIGYFVFFLYYSGPIFINIRETIKFIFILISIGYLNTKLCVKYIGYLNGKPGGGCYVLYFIILSESIIISIFIVINSELGKTVTICPLCNGAKKISNTKYKKLKRCRSCNSICGYSYDSLDAYLKFCYSCRGAGFIIEN